MQSESFLVTVLSLWENQRFRSIPGWGSPWRSDQFQNYTNIDGDVSVDFNSSTKKAQIDCPEGWDWIDKEWSIDFTRTCGPCDHHGWYYGASFDNVVSMSREKILDGTVSNSSVFDVGFAELNANHFCARSFQQALRLGELYQRKD